MAAHVPGVRRLCLVVDVQGYSGHDYPTQVGIQQRLDTVLRAGLAGANVGRWRIEQQDAGDGRLLILPAGLDETRAVPGLLRGLLVALAADRANRGGAPLVRLRTVLGQGLVQRAAVGYVGDVVVDVSRLVSRDELRAVLRADPEADLCLGVLDDLHRDVLRHGFGGFPQHGFRAITVRDEGRDRQLVAQVRALRAGDLPYVESATAAAAFGVPLVVAGTGSQWLAAHSLDLDDERPEDDDPDDPNSDDDPDDVLSMDHHPDDDP